MATNVKKYIVLLVAVSILIITIIAAMYMEANKWEHKTVATVNGVPITVQEILPRLTANRAEIFAYFKKQYNAEPDENFWNSSYKGEVPLEKLKKAAVDDCINIKIQQILSRDMEIIADISYSKFLKDLKAENDRRKKAIKNKQVIYGPEQYKEVTYFSVLFSNMTHELKKRIGSTFEISDEEIKSYYDQAIREGSFQKVATTKIEKIAIPFLFSDEKSRNAARELAEKIRAEFAKGEKFSGLSESYKNGPVKVEFSQQVFDAESNRDDSRPTTYEFTIKATDVPIGQVSEVFEVNNTFYIVKCIDKTDEGSYQLKETEESIKEKLKDEKYTQYINDKIKEADIQINTEIYNKLKVQ